MKHIPDDVIAEILSYPEAVTAIEEAFVALGDGRATYQSRIRTEGAIGKLSTVGAVLDNRRMAGAKVYTSSPQGQFRFCVVLFDPVEARWLATLDGAELTRIRTAATSLLVARRLANPESRRLALFGTGVQASGHAQAFSSAFPIDEISVVHYRDASAFTRALTASLDLPVRQVDACRAVSDADLVVTATRSKTPLFRAADVRPGAHITSIGATTPDAREIDPEVVASAHRVVVESIEQAQREAGNLLEATEVGLFAWDEAIELTELVRSDSRHLHEGEQVTLFDSLGIGLEDVAVASFVFAKWEARHAGAIP